MKIKIAHLLGCLTIVFLLVSFTNTLEKQSYKCMVQLKNYTGEGAYVVVSLVNNKNIYEETLYVIGQDPQWYNEIRSWWKFYGKRRINIDGISGATVSGGERKMFVLHIPKEKINDQYKLRFESAVEDQEYYETDLEISLAQQNLSSTYQGKGFIRYVKILSQ